ERGGARGGRRDHALHRGGRACRAQAAAHAADEREPGIVLWRGAEEALGTERLWIWRVKLRVEVHQQDRGGDVRPWREQVAAELSWFRRRPEHLGDDGPDSQRLLDDGIEVVLRLARLQLGRQALECRRGAQPAFERP